MKTIKFLDYEIINSGNSDAYVLTKPGGKLYECHLGNFHDLDNAKRTAIIYYMIARPEIFATQLARKAMGLSGTYHEYYKLIKSIKNDGLEIPKEITPGDGINHMIYYNNEPIKYA
jgi:hypothetical protein